MDPNELRMTQLVLKDELTMQGLVKDYLCPLCNEILYHAVQTACGHYFCRYCLLNWLSTGRSSCPLCHELYDESFREVVSIDEYIDSQFESVRRELQEERQLLIGSRYFPERKLCLQYSAHLQRRKTRAHQQQPVKSSYNERGNDDDDDEGSDELCLPKNSSHFQNKAIVLDSQHPDPEHCRIREEISEIFTTAKQSVKKNTRRRMRSISSRLQRNIASLKDETNTKTWNTAKTTEPLKDLSESNLDLHNLQKIEPLEPMLESMIGDGATYSNSIGTKLLQKANSGPMKPNSKLDVPDIKDSSEINELRTRISAQKQSTAAHETTDAASCQNEYKRLDDAKEETSSRERQLIFAEELVKKHESMLRTQVERFRNETDEIIGQLKSASRGLIFQRPEHAPQPEQQIQKRQPSNLPHTQLALANDEHKVNECSEECTNRPLNGVGINKTTTSKKTRDRHRVARSRTRRRKKCSEQLQISCSATSSLEAINSQSSLDVASNQEDFRSKRRESEFQPQNEQNTQLMNIADVEVAGKRSSLENEEWYERVVQAAVTAVTKDKRVLEAQSQHDKHKPEAQTSQIKNLQSLNPQKCQQRETKKSPALPKAKKMDTLDSGSWSKVITSTRKIICSGQRNPPFIKSVATMPCDLGHVSEEKNSDRRFVLGHKMQPRLLSKPFQPSYNPRNLPFGPTSPYFTWRPGMLMSPDRLPIPTITNADPMSLALSRVQQRTEQQSLKTATKKDKDELLELVRKQLDEDEEMRLARQARLKLKGKSKSSKRKQDGTKKLKFKPFKQSGSSK